MAASEPSSSKLWGGRFSGATDPVMEKFNNSLKFDKCMFREDIQGSIAYATALGREGCGILTQDEVKTLVDGLGEVQKEWESGSFVEKGR